MVQALDATTHGGGGSLGSVRNSLIRLAIGIDILCSTYYIINRDMSLRVVVGARSAGVVVGKRFDQISLLILLVVIAQPRHTQRVDCCNVDILVGLDILIVRAPLMLTHQGVVSLSGRAILHLIVKRLEITVLLLS